MPSEIGAFLIRLVVSAWSLAMIRSDWQHGQLPHWGTTWLLVLAAAVYAASVCLTGQWVALALPLAFLAVLLSDTWWAVLPAGGALLLSWGHERMIAAVLVWLLALGLVKLSRGATGAGDAKLVMVQIALFPDPTLAWLLAGGVALAAAVESIRRDGWWAPWTALVTAGGLLRGRLPETPPADSAAYLPIAHYLVLPGLLYSWLFWPGSLVIS